MIAWPRLTTPKALSCRHPRQQSGHFFEHKHLYLRIKGEVPAEDYVVPIGKANIVREGRDLSVITYAAMVHSALEAAEILKKTASISETSDLRTVSTLDREAITQTVKKTK